MFSYRGAKFESALKNLERKKIKMKEKILSRIIRKYGYEHRITVFSARLLEVL